MSQKTRAIIVGIAAGALLGATFAWIAGDGSGEEDTDGNALAHLGPGDYFTLGISILTLARQFGGMLRRV